MNLNTTNTQSFLQSAKTFITFSGRNKSKGRKKSEEEPNKHKLLRKTVSLGISGVDMTKEHDIWFGPVHQEQNGKMLKVTEEVTESQSSHISKFYSPKTKVGRDQNATTSQNSFKPKYHSHKVRGGREQNEHQLLPKHRMQVKHLPDKPGRRKFSLKGGGDRGRGGNKLHRRTCNLSCPDLASTQEDLGWGDNILDSVDRLDRNTVHMFRDKQYLETEWIEIHFD